MSALQALQGRPLPSAKQGICFRNRYETELSSGLSVFVELSINDAATKQVLQPWSSFRARIVREKFNVHLRKEIDHLIFRL